MATSFVFIVGWKAGRCNNVVEGSNGLGDNIHRATSLTSTLSLGHAHNANEPYVDPVAMHPLRLLPPSSNASKKAHSG
ncbi:unnamed protein product [Brassica oleracea var. botrytis]